MCKSDNANYWDTCTNKITIINLKVATDKTRILNEQPLSVATFTSIYRKISIKSLPCMLIANWNLVIKTHSIFGYVIHTASVEYVMKNPNAQLYPFFIVFLLESKCYHLILSKNRLIRISIKMFIQYINFLGKMSFHIFSDGSEELRGCNKFGRKFVFTKTFETYLNQRFWGNDQINRTKFKNDSWSFSCMWTKRNVTYLQFLLHFVSCSDYPSLHRIGVHIHIFTRNMGKCHFHTMSKLEMQRI